MLKLISIQAPNADSFCQHLAQYLSSKLDVEAEFINDIPWQERDQMIDSGAVDVAWLCGLPYVWKADRPQSNVELLAAAVMEGRRYMNQPVYFSDVVVRSDSPFKTFADLRGATWAYNETNSHSGYNVVRYHLATLGELHGYFGEVIESGAHQVSLEMILAGQIDASAIDSTVLETEISRSPDISRQIRVVDTLGPSPIPPWVISKDLPGTIKDSIRRLFVEMHEDQEGAEILQEGMITRFVTVSDRDYDPIREMEHTAAWVENL
jgi:phosphonate transport system substrate-binding protein